MGPDWVAASVRARAVAHRRIGAGGCARVSTATSLESALEQLTDTIYGTGLVGVHSLQAAQTAVSATVLWELRVLAGWMPVTGAALARCLAAGFELRNILARAEQLRGVEPTIQPFDLGALTTGWAQLKDVASFEELVSLLGRAGWGDPGHPHTTGELADVLEVLWLRRLCAVVPASRPWAAAACALLAARIVLVDRAEPSQRLVALMRTLVGATWMRARDLGQLASELPASVRSVIGDVHDPADLWRAEALLGARIESDGLQFLRQSMPGPDVVLGSLAVIAVDAWRLRAALAAADAGTSASATGREVAHVMA